MPIDSHIPPKPRGYSEAPSDLSGGTGPVRSPSRTPSPKSTGLSDSIDRPDGHESLAGRSGDGVGKSRSTSSVGLTQVSNSLRLAASPYQGVNLRSGSAGARLGPTTRSSSSSPTRSASEAQRTKPIAALENHTEATIDPSKIRDYGLNFIHTNYSREMPDPSWTGPRKKTPKVLVRLNPMSGAERDAEMLRIQDPDYQPERKGFTDRIKPLEDIGYTLRRASPMTQSTTAAHEASAVHLEDQIRQGLSRAPNVAVLHKETSLGRLYDVSMIITGPNGTRCRMATSWQFDKDKVTKELSPKPRLVTLWPMGVVGTDATEEFERTKP